MATITMLLCKVDVKIVEKYIHQVKACQQVWASTVKSFEIAFKSSPKSFKSGSTKYTQVNFVHHMPGYQYGWIKENCPKLKASK